jgi:hypothetical protein
MNTPDNVDRRYRDGGYRAQLVEDDGGAHLWIRHHGVIVGEIVVGVFEPGSSAPVSIRVTRFQPDELRTVAAIDVFD